MNEVKVRVLNGNIEVFYNGQWNKMSSTEIQAVLDNTALQLTQLNEAFELFSKVIEVVKEKEGEIAKLTSKLEGEYDI